jgi:hypothetical protein
LLGKHEYRSVDAARNSMFIVAEAGVFWVWKQRHVCIIRSIRDARVGIPWIGVGAVGKAASSCKGGFCWGRHGDK